MKNDKPLSGYRVIEFSTYMAAPSCARIMADWGADVIKVETMSGDAFRNFGESMLAPIKEEEHPMWEMYNANKRGVSLNLKTPEGKEILNKLLEKADVFLTNTRIDALTKMNLDYESLKEKYPQLIYAHITGYGDKGPDVGQPGFDVVAFWARSGFMVDLVNPGQYPVYAPAGFGDLAVGGILVGGICAALLERHRTHKGDKVSISLYGTAIWLEGIMMTSAQERYGNKFPKTRYEGHPLAIPYLCKDGEWIIITILEHEKYWPAFCTAIEREDLIEDNRFKTGTEMRSRRRELITLLEEVFAARDSGEWLKRLRKADIVHDKMRHFTDVLKDEQAWANDYLCNYTFANGEKAILPCTPVQSVNAGPLPYERGPLLGEHTNEILEELGFTFNQIEELSNNKIIKVR